MWMDNDHSIRMMVVDDDPGYREKMRMAFEGHHRIKVIALAQGGRDAIGQARDNAPDAAIVDLGLADMSGLDVAEQIAKVSPGTVVFIATDTPSMDLYRRATALGVKQVFTKTMGGNDIAGMVEQEVDAVREAMRQQSEKMPLVSPGTGPEGLRSGGAGRHTTKKLRTVPRTVLAVTSGIKGGVGKTTTSVAMACAAATQADLGVRVALADFNESGNITVQLNMGTPKNLVSKNILNWHYMSDNPSQEELEEFMVKHNPTGVWIVPAVPTPDRIVELNRDLIVKVVNILRKNFDLVICDLPPSITLDATWATIELADYVLVVVCPDDQEIAGIEQFNDTVTSLKCSTNKCYRVINKYNEPESLSIADLNKYQPYPMLGKFPYEPGVRRGRKLGHPFILESPQAEYGVSIRDTLNKLFPVFGESSLPIAGQKKGFLASLLSKFTKKTAM
jgi:MinD-like ATPase involved in chromosome partitioning or flagellar assembly/ActR/RegA family two-component response regulator